ncbi:MAG TPA: hypothetical protein VK464_07660 [Symbiobacteriaceae bacterium]|nr:hypothetical protein [Symbiobacteriaceae bacterium]
MQIAFNLWHLNVNGIESSSALNIGTNLLIGFGSSTKSVQGNGQLNGPESTMPTVFSTVDDRDEIDMPSWAVGPGGYMAAAPVESSGGATLGC